MMHVTSSISPINERDSFIEGDTIPGVTPQAIGPTNAPPPPPPPPSRLPPPPPPPPGLELPSNGLRRKRRVRSFFWKPIPEERVKERGKPNLWTIGRGEKQQYQIDVRTIEELFGQHEETRDSSSSLIYLIFQINILDSKRSMNVGIFLKQFKKSNHSIIEDIRFGNSEFFGAEPLRELLKLLPETEEVKKLQAFKGDPTKLHLVDSFMYLLTQIPRFEVRIEAMLLKEEFSSICSAMNHDIAVIRAATKELLTCEELHAILHLVLQAGNIMNAGGYAGNAVGFKLSSLLSLADTKANKPGMNLLHFVALEALKKDEKLLMFPEKLQHVQSAARISVENIELEVQSLHSRTRSIEEKIQKDTELLQQLGLFLQTCDKALLELKNRRLELRKEGNALIDFFCEDKDTFKLDECFTIFQDFCLKFKKAVKDNVERELKEANQQRRLKELEEKRHSWAGGEEVSGVFGLRSSSETDVDAALTREGLLDLLKPQPRSPQSPLGRFGSLRRSRQSPVSSAADRQLQNFLETNSDFAKPKNDVIPALSKTISPLWLKPNWTSPSHSIQRTNPETHQHLTLSNSPKHSSSHKASSLFPNTHTSEDLASTDLNQNLILTNSPHINTYTMSISVERHSLVPELQAFDVVSNPLVHHNDNLHDGLSPAKLDDLTLTDLETEGDTPSECKDKGEGYRTDVSAQTAGKEHVKNLDHLPTHAASTVSAEKDSSASKDAERIHSGAVSSNPKPFNPSQTSTDELSGTTSISEQSEAVSMESSDCDGAVEESLSTSSACDITVPENDESAIQKAGVKKQGDKTNASKSKPASNNTAGNTDKRGVQPVRTLTTSESQTMRRVVPISRVSRSGSSAKKSDKHNTEAQNHRTPMPHRTNTTNEDHKTPRTSSSKQATIVRNQSIRKNSTKPARPAVPKLPPEEKMCRSTMRSLAQATGKLGAATGEKSFSAPQTPVRSPASVARLPSFARNTVASTTRVARHDLAPVSANAASATSPKASSLSRATSFRHPVNKITPENPQAPIRRTTSIRSPRRNIPSETLSPPRGHMRKNSGSFSDKSGHSRDSMLISLVTPLR
uniref:FH2 domain-containing protein n=1 Tax=Denticeps clupeoides TaxID=299321 RepID=A0AAY4CV62_9TELE